MVAARILLGGGGAADTDEGGTKRQRSNAKNQKRDGKLTGMLVSGAERRHSLPGAAELAKFNPYGFLPLDGGEHLRWKFEVKEGSLVGTFSAMHDNPKKWIYDGSAP